MSEFGEGIPDSSLVKAEEFLKDVKNYTEAGMTTHAVDPKKLADWLVEQCRELRTRAEAAEKQYQDVVIVLAASRSQAARTKTELAAASIALGLAYDKLVEAGRNPQTNVDTALGVETPWTQEDIDRLRLEAEGILQTAMVDITKSQEGVARIDMLKYAEMGMYPKPGERPKNYGDEGLGIGGVRS